MRASPQTSSLRSPYPNIINSLPPHHQLPTPPPHHQSLLQLLPALSRPCTVTFYSALLTKITILISLITALLMTDHSVSTFLSSIIGAFEISVFQEIVIARACKKNKVTFSVFEKFVVFSDTILHNVPFDNQEGNVDIKIRHFLG